MSATAFIIGEMSNENVIYSPFEDDRFVWKL